MTRPALHSLAATRPAPLRFYRLAVGAWGRSTHEYLFPVKVFHKDADALALSALGLICEDFDLGSSRQAGFGDTVPEQIDRGAPFDTPVGHFAVRPCHIDPQPGVGIDQLHFCDLALQVERLVFIEGRRECVMCL